MLPLVVAAALASPPPPGPITWTKTVLDRSFRSEGVAVADVNNDGKMDVLTGEHWYQAPDWTPHEMQPAKDHGTGERNYSRSFACWSGDFNADGYADLIVIDFPGAPCYWMENPKGKPGHWAKHTIWHSACNETPVYADLLGTGKPVLVMGFQPAGKKADGNEGQMAYFTPNPADPTGLWRMNPISGPSEPGRPVPGTMRFSHGLGVGDVNGDRMSDVICTGGWWEQPKELTDKPWTFHPANLGEACADMFAHDLDGDGVNDVLSTSAHKFGIWWHKQAIDPKGGPTKWTTQPLFGMLASETHAAHFVDIDGDGLKDLVTGKRWWSHGRSEPGHSWDAEIYYLKASKMPDKITRFTPTLIDSDSGIGTQFVVADINGDGLLDIVSSNKKGVRVIVQSRAGTR
jgi:FG-GAP-like repeat/FG-GAP repeat